MKKLIIITLTIAAGLLLTLTGCKNDFGDLNQPEHAVTKVQPANQLAAATLQYGALAGRLYSTNYSFFIQWMTQGVYDDEQRYANFQGAWGAYYTGALANIQEAEDMLNDPDVVNDPAFLIANGAPQNLLGYAYILKAIIFKRVTDVFGAIPMSEALNSENITPAYDTQKEVYEQLVKLLRTARDTMDENLAAPKGDVIYGGDVAKLKKLANSLLLEVAMQISKVEPTTARNIFVEAYNNSAGLITDVGDEAWYYYDANAGIVNPWSRLRYADYYTSLQMWASMLGTDTTDAYGNSARVTTNTHVDNRILAFMQDPNKPGEDYFVLSPGSDFGQPWSELFSNAELPMPEETAAYVWLNIAEAAALGWISNITPADALQNAIKASYDSYNMYWNVCEKRGIQVSDWNTYRDNYATARAADIATYGAERVIAEEKWIALYPIAWKAWAEWRRTGYPQIHPLKADDSYNGGHIPTRYRYPAEEINLNNAHYLQALQDLTPAEDQNYSRVWWDIN